MSGMGWCNREVTRQQQVSYPPQGGDTRGQCTRYIPTHVTNYQLHPSAGGVNLINRIPHNQFLVTLKTRADMYITMYIYTPVYIMYMYTYCIIYVYNHEHVHEHVPVIGRGYIYNIMITSNM